MVVVDINVVTHVADVDDIVDMCVGYPLVVCCVCVVVGVLSLLVAVMLLLLCVMFSS